jgi:hypothetical protein
LRGLVRSKVAEIVVSKYLSSSIGESDGQGNSVAPSIVSGAYGTKFRFGNSSIRRESTSFLFVE